MKRYSIGYQMHLSVVYQAVLCPTTIMVYSDGIVDSAFFAEMHIADVTGMAYSTTTKTKYNITNL